MIEQALFTHITTDSTITDLMGTRLFPNKIPQGQPLPAAEYQQDGGKREHTMAGADGLVDSEYFITCYAESYSKAKELAMAIRQRMDGFSGTVGGVVIDVIFLTNEVDVPEFKAGTDILSRYGKKLTFTVWFKESVT
jgi:hypothetical protein